MVQSLEMCQGMVVLRNNSTANLAMECGRFLLPVFPIICTCQYYNSANVESSVPDCLASFYM